MFQFCYLQAIKQELRQLRKDIKGYHGNRESLGKDMVILQKLNKQLQDKLGELEHENINLRMSLQLYKLQQVTRSQMSEIHDVPGSTTAGTASQSGKSGSEPQ